MNGPFKYLAIGMLVLSKSNNLPGFVNILLVVVVIVAGIMSIFQFIGWIFDKLDRPMTVDQRNQAARDYDERNSKNNSSTVKFPTKPPPLPQKKV